MKWERLRGVRTAVLSVGGFAALSVSAFHLGQAAGWAAVGVSLLAVEFLSRPGGEGDR